MKQVQGNASSGAVYGLGLIGAAVYFIVARPAGDYIFAVPAIDIIVAAVSTDYIVPVTAINEIIIATGADRIIAVIAVYVIIGIASHQGVRIVSAILVTRHATVSESQDLFKAHLRAIGKAEEL